MIAYSTIFKFTVHVQHIIKCDKYLVKLMTTEMTISQAGSPYFVMYSYCCGLGDQYHNNIKMYGLPI